MKKPAQTIEIAPYTVGVDPLPQVRRSHVVVRDEASVEVARANYDHFLKRYDGIRISVKKFEYISDIQTVLTEVAKILDQQ